ncbi:MAG: aspartate aminotransferase family protein [Dehalococcoidia bacterium]
MTTVENPRPGLRKPDGVWEKPFSYHPFTPVLERAEGIYLYDEDGNRYMDASGGPMAVSMGHGDPRVVEAMTRQASKFAYAHPTLSSRPRAELCERISQKAPGTLNTTFLCSGGSEAIESAIKLARQYQLAKGNTQKNIVISRWESYHGMSLGALSVAGGPNSRTQFSNMVFAWPHIRQPSTQTPPRMSFEDYAIQCANELEEAIHYTGAENVSAFVATPLSQGEDYGLQPPPQYWHTIREICDKYDILLIADEVITGWGRTGKWFGMEHYDVQADIMVSAKGIASCYVPLAAVTVSDEVNEPFSKGDAHFFHGYTYQGHPVACAAGLAVIDILEKDGLIENSAEMGAYLHSKKNALMEHPTIADVRGQGLLFVPEFVSNKETMEFFPPEVNAEEKFQGIALKNGLAMYGTLYGPRRPAAHTRGLPLFIAPPLCITKEQVDELVDALDRSLTEFEKEVGVTS